MNKIEKHRIGLGIGYDSVMPTLNILAELGYCRVSGTIDSGAFKVEVSVPQYRDCYEGAGEFCPLSSTREDFATPEFRDLL